MSGLLTVSQVEVFLPEPTEPTTGGSQVAVYRSHGERDWSFLPLESQLLILGTQVLLGNSGTMFGIYV